MSAKIRNNQGKPILLRFTDFSICFYLIIFVSFSFSPDIYSLKKSIANR